jgi:hypothetical protein
MICKIIQLHRCQIVLAQEVGDGPTSFYTTLLYCLISVGYHAELRVAITFSMTLSFFGPTKSYHILWSQIIS